MPILFSYLFFTLQYIPLTFPCSVLISFLHPGLNACSLSSSIQIFFFVLVMFSSLTSCSCSLYLCLTLFLSLSCSDLFPSFCSNLSSSPSSYFFSYISSLSQLYYFFVTSVSGIFSSLYSHLFLSSWILKILSIVIYFLPNIFPKNNFFALLFPSSYLNLSHCS